MNTSFKSFVQFLHQHNIQAKKHYEGGTGERKAARTGTETTVTEKSTMIVRQEEKAHERTKANSIRVEAEVTVAAIKASPGRVSCSRFLMQMCKSRGCVDVAVPLLCGNIYNFASPSCGVSCGAWRCQSPQHELTSTCSAVRITRSKELLAYMVLLLNAYILVQKQLNSNANTKLSAMQFYADTPAVCLQQTQAERQ